MPTCRFTSWRRSRTRSRASWSSWLVGSSASSSPGSVEMATASAAAAAPAPSSRGERGPRGSVRPARAPSPGWVPLVRRRAPPSGRTRRLSRAVRYGNRFRPAPWRTSPTSAARTRRGQPRPSGRGRGRRSGSVPRSAASGRRQGEQGRLPGAGRAESRPSRRRARRGPPRPGRRRRVRRTGRYGPARAWTRRGLRRSRPALEPITAVGQLLPDPGERRRPTSRTRRPCRPLAAPRAPRGGRRGRERRRARVMGRTPRESCRRDDRHRQPGAEDPENAPTATLTRTTVHCSARPTRRSVGVPTPAIRRAA